MPLCSSITEVQGFTLMGLWATEEALSLIKEEEVLLHCEYVVPQLHVADLRQLIGRGTSEQSNL